jgi:hypothetical protein
MNFIACHINLSCNIVQTRRIPCNPAYISQNTNAGWRHLCRKTDFIWTWTRDAVCTYAYTISVSIQYNLVFASSGAASRFTYVSPLLHGVSKALLRQAAGPFERRSSLTKGLRCLTEYLHRAGPSLKSWCFFSWLTHPCFYGNLRPITAMREDRLWTIVLVDIIQTLLHLQEPFQYILPFQIWYFLCSFTYNIVCFTR